MLHNSNNGKYLGLTFTEIPESLLWQVSKEGENQGRMIKNDSRMRFDRKGSSNRVETWLGKNSWTSKQVLKEWRIPGNNSWADERRGEEIYEGQRSESGRANYRRHRRDEANVERVGRGVSVSTGIGVYIAPRYYTTRPRVFVFRANARVAGWVKLCTLGNERFENKTAEWRETFENWIFALYDRNSVANFAEFLVFARRSCLKGRMKNLIFKTLF